MPTRVYSVPVVDDAGRRISLLRIPAADALAARQVAESAGLLIDAERIELIEILPDAVRSCSREHRRGGVRELMANHGLASVVACVTLVIGLVGAVMWVDATLTEHEHQSAVTRTNEQIRLRREHREREEVRRLQERLQRPSEASPLDVSPSLRPLVILLCG